MAKRRVPKKTIYFTIGHATEEDYAAVEELGLGTVLRRADKIVPADPLEEFDAVAGEVPDNYAAEAARRAAEGDDSMTAAPLADGSALTPASPVAPVVPPVAPATANPWKPNA